MVGWLYDGTDEKRWKRGWKVAVEFRSNMLKLKVAVGYKTIIAVESFASWSFSLWQVHIH